MLKQAKKQAVDDPVDEADEAFSELDVLDDSNSMYMVRQMISAPPLSCLKFAFLLLHNVLPCRIVLLESSCHKLVLPSVTN